MAYANQFVASIIHNNKVQREFNKDGQRAVQLPFDSEYTIRVQNKTFLKASADILIDGISIFSSGKQLILNPSQTINVERFVNDLKSGNKFKFVSMQKAIAEGHQDPTSVDFGMISVVFTPQKVSSLLDGISISLPITTIKGTSGGVLRSASSSKLFSSANINANSFAASNCTATAFASASIPTSSFASAGCVMDSMEFAPSSVGGTVEGGKSNQQFQESNEFIVWDFSKATTIKMKLVGEVKQEIPFPNTVYVNNKYVNYQWMNQNPDGSIVVCYK